MKILQPWVLTSTPNADSSTIKGLNSAPNGNFWSEKGLTSTPYEDWKFFVCLRFCGQLLLVDVKSWMRENSNRGESWDLFSKASNSEVRLQPQILMWRPQKADQWLKLSQELPIESPESLNKISFPVCFLQAKVLFWIWPPLRKPSILKNWRKTLESCHAQAKLGFIS